MILKVALDDKALMPTKAHETDAGYDIYSPVCRTIIPKGSVIIDTGVHVDIPKGYVGMLKSKSGLNVKHGIISEGVIDSGYSGSIVVKLNNLSDEFYTIEKKDKITQLVVIPIAETELVQVESFAGGERGDNGFGSTGR
jgi:dUTP pyrophosphatase